MAHYDSGRSDLDSNEASAIKSIFLREERSTGGGVSHRFASSRHSIDRNIPSLVPVPPTVVYCYILRSLRYLFSVERNRKGLLLNELKE